MIWVLLIWEVRIKLDGGSQGTLGSQGWICSRTVISLRSRWTGRPADTRGLQMLRTAKALFMQQPFPGAVGSTPATWSGNQVRVRYRHQDPESTGSVSLRTLRDTKCLRDEVGLPQECFCVRCTQCYKQVYTHPPAYS